MKAGEVVAGRYRLESRLGIGGMGEVWRALHTGTGRDFAIKFMHAHAASSENARQRFSREARASAKINHPNIIDVFDVGELDDGVLFLVMELLDGVPLGDAFYAQPPLTVQDFLSILLDTSQALAAAHAVGIIHRDIKPANIFLHRDRTTGLAFAKILDFGISKFTNDDVGTKTGSILGSPRYMSPEQTRSAAAADARADLWAMGVMIFEALTGTWPHEGDSFSALVVNICTLPPASIDEVAPHLPETIRSIVRDCLKPMAERMHSADELSHRIEIALGEPMLASLDLPRPLHAPGEGIKSTTGLRVRPPSLSTSRNQARASGRVDRPRVSDPGGAPMSVPLPRDRTPAPQAVSSPPANSGAPLSVATQVLGNETFTSDAMTLAVEAPSAPIPSVTAPVPANASVPAATPSGALPPMPRPRMPSVPTEPFPQPPMVQTASSAHPSGSYSALARGAPLPAMTPLPQPSAPPAAAPRPPDPLVASVSAMHIDAIAQAKNLTLHDSANLAPTSQRAPSVDLSSPPPFARSSSNRRLGITAAVLAVALIGIVVALVATIRSGPEVAADPSASPSSGPAAASPPPAAAPPEASAAPIAEAPVASAPAAAPTPTTPPPTETAAASASASAAAKEDRAKKKDVPPKTAPPAAPRTSPPPRAETPPAEKKPAKRVQDLGSGL